MCAAILAARLQCGTLAGGGIALVAGGDCARRGVAHAASIVCSIYVRTKQGRKKKSIVQQRKETKKSRSRSVTRKIHQPIALNARAHEHTRVLRHSIIFVHAYNKVIDAKYRICKIELFSKDIIRRRFKMGCCPWQTKVITK